MPTLDTEFVPDAILAANPARERVSATASALHAVPAVLGWATHAGLRLPDVPEQTHVCASTYDHLNIDLPATKVAALYVAHPQPATVVSLAGQPSVLSIEDAIARLGRWGAPLPASARLHAPSANELYFASPVFLLHAQGQGHDPLAIVACGFTAWHNGPDEVFVDVSIDSLAVDPTRRGQGLAHLAVLEASRWLAMLTRHLHFYDQEPITFGQRVYAAPANATGYHLAQAFLSNYMFFSVTDELIERASDEHRQSGLDPNSIRTGHAAIRHHAGVADHVEVPADAFDYLESEPMLELLEDGDDDRP